MANNLRSFSEEARDPQCDPDLLLEIANGQHGMKAQLVALQNPSLPMDILERFLYMPEAWNNSLTPFLLMQKSMDSDNADNDDFWENVIQAATEASREPSRLTAGGHDILFSLVSSWWTKTSRCVWLMATYASHFFAMKVEGDEETIFEFSLTGGQFDRKSGIEFRASVTSLHMQFDLDEDDGAGRFRNLIPEAPIPVKGNL